MRSKILVGVVGVSCMLLMWLITSLYQELLEAYEQSGSLTDIEYSWFFRLLLNLAGYSTVLVPGFILYKYLQKTNYFDKINNQTCLSRCLFACFGPNAERLPESARAGEERPSTASGSAREGAELAFCFTGLMGAYLVWGLLQEKIMTQSYVLNDGSLVRFNDSQFLVLVNRLAALVVAVARLLCVRAPLVPAPLYQFSYCALTNVLSAWCQYEALKYVSFPTQVLSKSCKVIPVMLMGKLISRNKYASYEYITAVMISIGMVLFMLGSHDDEGGGGGMSTSASGVALLCVYMVCDSFTSSWQSALFTRTRCAPLQMLAAVNLFSCALTVAALPHRATTSRSFALLQNGAFVADCVVLAASSALGQLLIYRTIASFGAVVFTIIMTARQAVSILLSCMVYGHAVSAGGAVGVLLVFVAIFLRLYCRQRLRRHTNTNTSSNTTTKPKPRTHAITNKL